MQRRYTRLVQGNAVGRRRSWRRAVGVMAAAAGLVAPMMMPQVAHAANAPYYNAPPEFPAIDTATIHEYPTVDPSLYPFPSAITRGPDGNVWFVELFTHMIDRITPTGQLTRFPTNPDGYANDITAGPDGNLWFTTSQANIAHVSKITTSGVVTDYPLSPPGCTGPNCVTGLYNITSGPNGKLWATGGPGIVSIDPATGAFQRFPITGLGFPTDITVGPDGNLWFSTANQGGIGSMTPSGTVTRFPIPDPSIYMTDSITVGPDGNLWFVAAENNMVGKVTLSGTVTLYALPVTSSFPQNITAGPDGNLWFTQNSGLIGRITPAGVITEVHIPTPMSGPDDITTGADGKLWFTEQQAGQVASLDPTTLTPPAAPCLTITHTTVLNHDVGPCAGDGIVIAANNVTLRLNGHRVFAAAGERYGDFAGIHLLGVSGVTVDGQSPGAPTTAGSEVTGFDAGVFVDFGSNNTITKLNIHDNIGPADPNVNLGDGIFVAHSAGNVLMGNRIVRNGIFDNVAVLGLGSNNNRIVGNDVEQGYDPGGAADYNFFGLGSGIISNAYLEQENPGRGGPITGTQVIANTVVHNAGAGISTINDDGAVVQDNTSSYNGFFPDGTYTDSTGNGIGIQSGLHALNNTADQVIGNVSDNNAGYGISVQSMANQIKNNTAVGNGQTYVYNGQVYGTFDLFDNNANCGTNIWLGNIFTTNSPPCTGNGGQQVTSAPAPAPAVANAKPRGSGHMGHVRSMR